MLNNCGIIAFIATKQPEAAKQFYEKILGLELISDDPFALVFNANGTMLRIQKVHEYSPVQFTVLGWEVADINIEINELSSKGVVFNRYEGLTQDENNIWTAPGGSKIAWFSDPDGNTLSLTQFEE